MDKTGNDTEHDLRFERAVSEALGRLDAPEGFTERVLARAAAKPAKTPVLSRLGLLLQMRAPVWGTAFAAAALLAITAGSLRVEHVRAEHRREDAAAAQFTQAMQLTDHALDRVDAQLQQTSIPQITKALQEVQ